MTTSTPARTVDLGTGLRITLDDSGAPEAAAGRPVLLLHGGAGPRTVAGLAAGLSAHHRVLTPTHPGFAGTPRAPWLASVPDLADAYLDLLEELGLGEVVVVGNSLGGWVAAEMALRDIGGRISSLVLLNATGIRPDDPHQITDIRTLPPAAVGRLAIHDPALRPDPAALTDDERAAAAADQQALAHYAGDDFLFAPKLRRRLRRVAVPVLVAWGEEDGVLSADYGRSYAAAFPAGRYHPIAAAGHLPQLEQPAAVLAAVEEFAGPPAA
jgi:pimeloyl-ACP methyl ester carboxylesterase